jgi:hypothetical protein
VIWVDDLRSCGAPWRGGIACHMVSDESVEELVSFASALGLPRAWFQYSKGTEHYELSPRLRAKALRWGARACSAHEMGTQLHRMRECTRERQDAALAALEARAQGHHGTGRS